MKLAPSTCAIPPTFRFPKIPLLFPSSFSSPMRWQAIGFSAASLSSFSSDSSIDSAVEPTKRQPWLLIGLGNPGNKYQGTHHNVGFEMIDAVAVTSVSFKSLFGKDL